MPTSSPAPDRSGPSRRTAADLLAEALARPHVPAGAGEAARVLVVDVARQRLIAQERGGSTREYPISTASAGIGSAEGSNRTPPGWHRIARKIGAGEPMGRVFESREPLDRVWQGEPDDRDLILTRILTLEGLEPGVNQGAGVDSLERYIYVHGTNQEAALGTAASHGCVRMSNADVADLFDRVHEGDHVVVVPGPVPMPDPRGPGRFHYAGLAGSGMSALAQFQAMLGGKASGSDRAFDRGDSVDERAKLEQLGIAIHPQDGSGIGADCAALVVSTAVEDSVPDVAAARRWGIPIVHRSELLAFYVHVHRSIAVTGTSGKSSVVAMVFELLRAAGRDPSVITGGDLVSLEARGLIGNAWRGGSDLLVVESDESDGSVVRYHPAIGVILNLQKDHKEMDVVATMFEAFRSQVRETLVLGEEANLDPFAAAPSGVSTATAATPAVVRFGFDDRADVRATDLVLEPAGSRFEVDGLPFRLAVPGRHNVKNALAAIAACRAVGVPLADLVAPLAAFEGVSRRFQVVGAAHGVEVVDDFAHNPAKLAASIETAQTRAARVLAVFQPHGYGPTRFLRPDLVETFGATLRPQDRLWMIEIFYAGGSAVRDFSSADLVTEIVARGAGAEYAPSREALVERIAAEARPGDLVLVMGARDPSLTALAKQILSVLQTREPSATARLGGA